MSQTHTPHEADPAGDDTGRPRGRRRSRRRADSHSGDRCRMCRQTVIVDHEGRCQLGHQVVSRTEMAQRLADREAEREAARRPFANPTEIDLDHGLPPTVPASFSTTLPGTAEPGRGDASGAATDDGAAAGARQDQPQPIVLPPDTTPSAPHQDSAHVPTPAQGISPTIPTDDRWRPTHLDTSRPPREPQRRWVPGVGLGGRRLEAPVYLSAVATRRGPARPDEPVLPVMEELPPLPHPPPPDGPQVARSLFHQALGEPEGRADEVEAADAAEQAVLPAAPQEPWAVVLPGPPARTALPDPAARSALPEQPARSALPERPGQLSPADLTPEARSVLDLELPASAPRADPVYELEPVTDDDVIPPRGPLQIIAGSVFVLLLLSAAWYLATSL